MRSDIAEDDRVKAELVIASLQRYHSELLKDLQSRFDSPVERLLFVVSSPDSSLSHALAGAMIGAGTAVGLFLALLLFGFAPGGIAAGSLAAVIHSSIGDVAAGSLFAYLQSIGATSALLTVGAPTGAIVGGASAFIKKTIEESPTTVQAVESFTNSVIQEGGHAQKAVEAVGGLAKSIFEENGHAQKAIEGVGDFANRVLEETGHAQRAVEGVAMHIGGFIENNQPVWWPW